MPHADPEVRREYMRQYKEANRERLRVQAGEWRRKRSAQDPEFKARERAAEKRWRDRNPGKVRAKNERWARRNSYRERNLNHLYGITEEDYKQMFEAQAGRCAICAISSPDRTLSGLCVDHDHVTGKVRGLLCRNCNTGIGMLEDSSRLLRKALAYLEEHDGTLRSRANG